MQKEVRYMAEITYQNKIRTIAKLSENGITTEKQLLAMKMESVLKLPDVKIQEITIINELQQSIRNNKLFSYLTGGGEKL